MSEENRQQQSSAESTVAGAAKTGKAVANIAKGAATGGAHGAAIEAAKSSKKWIIPIVAIILLPVLIIAMLPSLIFGSLFGDGTDTPSGISDDTVLVQNMTDINSGISMILSEGLNDVLARIDSDFAASGCDGKEVNNPFGSDVVFNANAFVSQYCAYKDTDAASISKDDMESLLAANKDKLYSFTHTDEVREIPAESEADSTETTSSDTTTEEPAEPTYETIRVYTISYNGEAYFADQVFRLSDEQKLLASQYAQNLTVLLGDGVYQGLSETEFSAMGLSYEGVVFSDGETQVVYYNQLDERWKYELYGTDTIGGYACGPTAMSIVVSSLTSETVDPPHMAQWAYENGYWCSGNGSYHSLIPGAAEAWGLSVEGCTATEPQRIVDALADGKLVVAIMTKGHFTSSGHFIVLRGCTADGEILVADPASYQRSEKSWDMSIILNEASKSAGAVEAFHIHVEDCASQLLVMICDYGVSYAELVLNSGASTKDMYKEFEDFKDCIYEDACEVVKDEIYEDLLGEIKAYYYDGVINDAKDSVQYSDWSDARSDTYGWWSDVRGEVYSNWSNTRGDLYSFYSDIRGELYSGDTGGADNELQDFKERVEKIVKAIDRRYTVIVEFSQ